MKTNILLASLFLVNTVSLPHEGPQFKTGTVMEFTLNLNGQTVPYSLKIKNRSDVLDLEWKIRSYGTGIYEQSAKAQQSADLLNFDLVNSNTITRLKDNETFISLSKDAFNSLQKKGGFVFDGYTFKKEKEEKPLLIAVDGKDLDLIYVVSEDASMEMWVLNNPDFPLLCQVKGNPMKLDFTLRAIQN